MIKKIKLSAIDTESGTQTRVLLHEETIADYAEAMKGRVKFPPVIVFHDGTVYYLADGFHRVMAAIRNGAKEIEADVRKGSCLDALKYALGANTDHGLRRTNADKRKCVTLALAAFGKLSDRGIADMCGVGAPMVGEQRKSSNCNNITVPRTGLDGKTRKLPAPSPAPAKPERKEEKNNQEEGKEEEKERPILGPMADDSEAMMSVYFEVKEMLSSIQKMNVAKKTIRAHIARFNELQTIIQTIILKFQKEEEHV